MSSQKKTFIIFFCIPVVIFLVFALTPLRMYIELFAKIQIYLLILAGVQISLILVLSFFFKSKFHVWTGFVTGIFTVFMIVNVYLSYLNYMERSTTENALSDFKKIQENIEIKDYAQAVQDILNSKVYDLPVRFCIIAWSQPGSGYSLYTTPADMQKPAIETADLVLLADELLKQKISSEVKQAILFNLAYAIVDRKKIQSMDDWFKLWKKHISVNKLQIITVKHDYDPFCSWGDTEYLQNILHNEWGDDIDRKIKDQGLSFID